MTVKQIFEALNRLAPTELAEEGDNVGILAGDANARVTKALIALDITGEVIKEAKEAAAELVISHHPVIYRPLATLGASSVAYRLAQSSLSAICMHTNLDAARGGVSDALADALGLKNISPIGEFKFGRLGELKKPLGFHEFAAFVRDALGSGKVRAAGAPGIVKKAAVCGGSADSLLLAAAKETGADVLVLGEVKHSLYIQAGEMGLRIVEAGHFSTENVVCAVLLKYLSAEIADVEFEIAKTNKNPYFYI
jgi:dinuclear metal center YbgI/SA1388 family protein